MHRKRKIFIGLLGLGILIGHLSTEAYASKPNTGAESLVVDQEVVFPLTVTGETLKKTITIGSSLPDREKNHVITLESSSWEGDLIMLEGAEGAVFFNHQSKWQGNVENSGKANLTLQDRSKWQGHFFGIAANGPENSVAVTLSGGSTWEGNLEHQKKGAFDRITSDQSSSVYSTYYINIGHPVDSAENSSQWMGNVTIESEKESIVLFPTLFASNWIGNLDMNVKGDAEEASLRIGLSKESYWEGNAYFFSESQKGSQNKINIDHSIWRGNLEYHGDAQNKEGAAGSLRIQMTSQSYWGGSAKLSGQVNLDMYLANATWDGDLDLHENQAFGSNGEVASIGSLVLTNSQWRGKILSDEASVKTYLMSGSIWGLTGDSTVTTLSSTKSSISFLKKTGEFSTLTVQGDFRGANTKFSMNTDLAANAGDLLEIQGGLRLEGEAHQISINNQGSAWVNPAHELTIVKVKEAVTISDTTAGEVNPFILSHRVEVGGFEYGLKRVGNDWNLYTTGRSTTTAGASLNAFIGSYLLNYAEQQNLLKRLGDLRGGKERDGIWARVYGGEFESRGNHFLRGFEMNYSGVQVGMDKKRERKDQKGTVYYGGMFGYTQGNLDHGAGSGSVDSKSLGAYWTHLSPKGFYADLVLKYGWMNHDFKVLDSTGVAIRGSDIDTQGFSGSLEVGKRIYLGLEKKDRWYLEPQAQLTISHQSGDSFTASNGLEIQVESLRSVLGRIGLNLGYAIKKGENPIHLYGKVSYLHEFEGDIGVSYNGIRATEHLGDSWWSYGVGATVQLGKRHRLYLDIERADGARFRQPWAMSGGYRFSW